VQCVRFGPIYFVISVTLQSHYFYFAMFVMMHTIVYSLYLICPTYECYSLRVQKEIKPMNTKATKHTTPPSSTDNSNGTDHDGIGETETKQLEKDK